MASGGRLGSQHGLEGAVLPAELRGTSEALLFSRRPPGRAVMARPAQGGRGSEKLGHLLRADQHRRGGARIPEAPAGSPRSPSSCSVTQGHTQGPHCGPSGSPRVLTVAPEDHQCPHCDPRGHPGFSLWPQRVTHGPHCGSRGSPRALMVAPEGHPGSSLWPQGFTQCPHCNLGGHPGPHCGPRGSPTAHI